MKKFAAFMMVAVAMTGFASCDDDDEENDLADAVVTNAEGYTLASAKYFNNMLSEGDKLVITKTSANTVNVVLTSTTWGTFTINDAVVTNVEGVNLVAGEGIVLMPAHGEEKEYEATFAASITGEGATYTFVAPTVMTGTTVNFYAGKTPASFAVAGSYKGTVSAFITKMSMDCGSVEDQTVKLEVAADGTVSMTIPAFTYVAMSRTFPAATLNGIEVVANEDGSYAISKADVLETVTDETGAEKEYKGSVSGTINADKTANIIYELQYGSMPMAIKFTFVTATSTK
ncbi:MAG: calycin-like domain-containing protein [Bacteroidales bacterium]|nr:calycin-like domain-containing protein [Bacteroidales bacterium]